ncbi:MAG: hypothetical protein HC881_23835 [Leptolyngbyaceae cyanobacterium SL_7_1]|nr:hypothetical protein [Leptolyngbyaceae cyanobacterium SL_7_1]
MTSSPDPKPNQHAQAGRDVTQAGNDIISTRTTNFNFVFILIGILALGGIAWGVYTAHTIEDPGNTFNQEQVEPEQPQ